MENDKKLRVAAYVRISVETKETHHSLYAQEDFYRKYAMGAGRNL